MSLTYVLATIAACIVSSALSIAIAALFFRFERRYGRKRGVSQHEPDRVLRTSTITTLDAKRTPMVEDTTDDCNIEMGQRTPTTTATTTTDPVVLSETALMVYEDKENEKTGVDSSIRLVRRDLEDKLDFGIKQNASGEFFITDLSIADTLKGQVKEGDEIVSCEIEMKGFPIQLATAVIQSTLTNMSRLKLRNRSRKPLEIPVITVTDVEIGCDVAGLVQASVASTPSRSSSRSSRTSRGSRRNSTASRSRNSSVRR